MNVNYSGNWNSGTSYNQGDFVVYQNVMYIALGNVLAGQLPPDVNLSWELVVYGAQFGPVTPTPSVTVGLTPTPTPTSSEIPVTPTETPTVTITPTTSELPVTPTPTSSEIPATPTQTATPTPTPQPVTGYSFNLVALPYNFPSSGNSIMNNSGGINSGSTEINLLNTSSRGFYFNAIDSGSVDRTNYFSSFTGQNVTVTFTQTGNTAIYSGDTDSFKFWDAAGDSGFVFGTGIGVPPNPIPSGNATLIQSATTEYTIGLPVYVSLQIV